MFVHMPRQFIFSRPKSAQHIFAFKAQNENQSNQLFRNLFREQEMVENEFFIGSFIIHYVFQFFLPSIGSFDFEMDIYLFT